MLYYIISHSYMDTLTVVSKGDDLHTNNNSTHYEYYIYTEKMIVINNI